MTDIVSLDNSAATRRRIDPDVGGTLTNTGSWISATTASRFSSDSVTAKSFVNSGTVDLSGNGSISAALNVSGATTNNGSISISADTEELAGAVGGTGSFSLSNANLQFELERFGRADHHRDRRGRAHAQAGAVLRRHDQRFRDRRHDRRDELSPRPQRLQFRREFGGHGRHAHAETRRKSDRQYPDDRRLLELEFHPRPRQRDRHAGEVRLSRQPGAGGGIA